MINIVFFARIKEELGCASVQLDWQEQLSTIAGLQEYLCARNNGQWNAILSEDNIIRALNHVVVLDDAIVSDNDEVAFYPPVTGG